MNFIDNNIYVKFDSIDQIPFKNCIYFDSNK